MLLYAGKRYGLMSGKDGMESIELPELATDHDHSAPGTPLNARTARPVSTCEKDGLRSKAEPCNTHVLVDMEDIPFQSLDTGRRVTFKQVLWQTYWARVWQGPTAVAPVLRPYLNATRWPSGAPLPMPILKSTRKGARPWLQCPNSDILSQGALYIPFVSTFLPTLPIFLVICFILLVGGDGLLAKVAWQLVLLQVIFPTCISVGTLLCLCVSSEQLVLHVRALYILLCLDSAASDQHEEVLKDMYVNLALPAVAIEHAGATIS